MAASLRNVHEAARYALLLRGAFGKGATHHRRVIDATEVDGATTGTAFRVEIDRLEVLVSRRAHASSRLEVGVHENAAITW